ncbi:fimbrial biogenesis chaperone [Shewanella fidelis]|uniref:Molecular chaperone n=1 Tax=Shewanella fidelis TaxID=173509 RepID=A0AAW8NLT7_9GAMM|nr:molecular chaperone [Shewanella fidelis]MDR8523822.1 molecular chaperone [Shewanella fidelis]MDW4810370.1 molecular chaperone [Shewanella fidelis]MDW4814515.1 molecular chaperone [Shewanella fidelis]MDW4818605.1 molecular chaperone [Shewanella fidelis]MDW4823742.1 molecular chaperone [Shewanella fidelis]
MYNYLYIGKLTIILMVVAYSNCVEAAVVANKSRLVMPAKTQTSNVFINSLDVTPNMVQVWVTQTHQVGDVDYQDDAQFFVSPPVFKLDNKQGQQVKIVYTGSDLPSDRESLFYFHFLVLPPLAQTEGELNNQLLITQKHTLKLFYRPEFSGYHIDDVVKHIKFSLNQTADGSTALVLQNRSPFFVTIPKLTYSNAAKIKRDVLPKEMLAPWSSLSLPLHPQDQLANSEIEFTLINDQGGRSLFEALVDIEEAQ